MNAQERKELQIAAAKIRLGIIEGVFHAKSGHPGGSLSAAELFAYLYGKELNVDPKNPKDPDRDPEGNPENRPGRESGRDV